MKCARREWSMFWSLIRDGQSLSNWTLTPSIRLLFYLCIYFQHTVCIYIYIHRIATLIDVQGWISEHAKHMEIFTLSNLIQFSLHSTGSKHLFFDFLRSHTKGNEWSRKKKLKILNITMYEHLWPGLCNTAQFQLHDSTQIIIL